MKYFKQNNRIILNSQPIRKNRVLVQKTQIESIEGAEKIDLSSYEDQELRVGYSSTWKVSCGIAVYTEHLFNALKHKGVTVFVYPNTLSVGELLYRIDKDRIHVLNIQYEPSITYNLSNMIMLFNELKKRKIKIVLTFHSESDHTEKLISLADEAIFHKVPTRVPANFMNKINIIKMGVPVFEPSSNKESLRELYGIDSKAIVLTTTGFMFTWKQHTSILEALVPLLQSNKNLHVQLLTAFNSVNPKECELEERNIQNVVNMNKLQTQVTHLTSFLPQQELSERLYMSDIGYLWGGLSTTSSSAASKEFISARLPLVVTESNHYHDLSSGIIRTPIDKNEFVNNIIALINDSEKLERLKEQQELNYKNLNNNNIIFKHIRVFKKE